MTDESFQLFSPATPEELDGVRRLFTAYSNELSVDLGFQNFEAELLSLPGPYLAPHGALRAIRRDEQLAGCCAMRALSSVDYPNAAEMKRLYVAQEFRGFGLGRMLAEDILDLARRAGYSFILLDTLSDMEAARGLYEDLGFVEIPPYYHNPLEGAHYLMARL